MSHCCEPSRDPEYWTYEEMVANSKTGRHDNYYRIQEAPAPTYPGPVAPTPTAPVYRQSPDPNRQIPASNSFPNEPKYSMDFPMEPQVQNGLQGSRNSTGRQDENRYSSSSQGRSSRANILANMDSRMEQCLFGNEEQGQGLRQQVNSAENYSANKGPMPTEYSRAGPSEYSRPRSTVTQDMISSKVAAERVSPVSKALLSMSNGDTQPSTYTPQPASYTPQNMASRGPEAIGGYDEAKASRVSRSADTTTGRRGELI